MCEDQVIEFVGQKSPEEDQQVPLPTTSIQTRTCPVCGYQSNCLSSLIRHRRVHTTEYPFRCRLCSKTSKWKSNLVRHAAKMHGVRVVSRQPSVDSPDLCPRASSSTDDVISTADGASVSGIDQPSTSGVSAVSGLQLDNGCTDCPYAAKDRHSLRNHMQRHRRARTNSGTAASQQNGTSGMLRCRRRRFQSPQTPTTDAQPAAGFRCSVCDFTSTNSSSVKKHIACKRSNHASAYVVPFDQTATEANSCNGESTPTPVNGSAADPVPELVPAPAPAPSPASTNGADCTATDETVDAGSAATVATASTSTPQRQNGVGKAKNNTSNSKSKSKPKSKAADESRKAGKKATAGPVWQCLICDQLFLVRDEAVSHLKAQHRMQPYCCLYCDFGSVEESACNEHVGCSHPNAGLMSVIENLAPITNTVRQRSTRRPALCVNAQRPDADLCLYPTTGASEFDGLPTGTMHWCPPVTGHLATFTFEQLADVVGDFVAIVDALVDDPRQPSFAEQLRTEACAPDGLFHLEIPDADDDCEQSLVDVLLAKAATSVPVLSANAQTNSSNTNAGHGSEEIQMALANGIEPLRTELVKITMEVNGLKRMMWQCRFCPHTSKKRANVRIHEKTHLRAKKGAPQPQPPRDPDEPPEKIPRKDDDANSKK
ncbi:zinc finger protein [Trichinella spiralis]|uniref:zinc finger protein n=1 Tax=Trichinella spiralis TaxID=6334 RepID=UPI0001EFC842|nr:zinc finger protein [Trichinella spiralis]